MPIVDIDTTIFEGKYLELNYLGGKPNFPNDFMVRLIPVKGGFPEIKGSRTAREGIGLLRLRGIELQEMVDRADLQGYENISSHIQRNAYGQDEYLLTFRVR